MASRPELPRPSAVRRLLTPAIAVISSLIRLSGTPAREPYWARAMRYRFDDCLPSAGKRFGVLYAGDGLETAFAESVLHEASLYRGGRYLVAEEDIDRRAVVTFRHPARDTLTLADFTGKALKSLGLNNDISAGDDYTLPQQWSRLVHETGGEWDGIRYVSRQQNDACCYAIFDRSGLVKKASRPMTKMEKRSLRLKFRVSVI